MGAAVTGPQYTIRGWDLASELLQFLASQGVGVFVPGARTGNTLWLGKMPSTPVVAGCLILDPAPTSAGLARHHLTLMLRGDERQERAVGTRAAVAYEALHQRRPTLASFDLFCTVDNLPGALQYEANRFPMSVLNISTAGMVHRA